MTTTDDAWIKAERHHEREMAELASRERYDKRHQLTDRIMYACVAFGVVGVTAVIALLLYSLAAKSTEQNTERDRICAESGGARVPLQNGPTLCMKISEQP